MEKKFTEFSREDAARLAQCPAGQQLLARMQQQPEAAASVERGDLEQARQAVQSLMTDPQTRALLRQLWEEYYG